MTPPEAQPPEGGELRSLQIMARSAARCHPGSLAATTYARLVSEALRLRGEKENGDG
jgi:hypothetical protein